MTDCDEDSDFIESDHDFESEEDDNECDRKVNGPSRWTSETTRRGQR